MPVNASLDWIPIIASGFLGSLLTGFISWCIFQQQTRATLRRDKRIGCLALLNLYEAWERISAEYQIYHSQKLLDKDLPGLLESTKKSTDVIFKSVDVDLIKHFFKFKYNIEELSLFSGQGQMGQVNFPISENDKLIALTKARIQSLSNSLCELV